MQEGRALVLARNLVFHDDQVDPLVGLDMVVRTTPCKDLKHRKLSRERRGQCRMDGGTHTPKINQAKAHKSVYLVGLGLSPSNFGSA